MFHIAKEDDIKNGLITDVYFCRTEEILRRKGLDQQVVAEVVLKDFPSGSKWGVLAGLEEVAYLMEGLPVDVYAMPEGTIFDLEQPVLYIEGRYIDFLRYETSLLGLLCQASGIATKSSQCRKVAGDRILVSFGARRMHPAIAPMIERNAFIGGCDGVAVSKSAELIHEKAVGTMPHSLILMIGDTVEACLAFHEIISPEVKRVALIDTFCDEKDESVRVAQKLGQDLFAVRLDTPSSRRGNMRKILEEVRWELNLRGFQHVRLFVSGGLDEEQILTLNPVADAYGVGTAISNAPVLDFSLDIVEIAGQPLAKRGKKSGKKKVLFCANCFKGLTLPDQATITTCSCGSTLKPLLTPFIKQGKIIRQLHSAQEIRKFVLEQLPRLK